LEAIGSILLKPGKLQVAVATSATTGSQLADDVIGLATRLTYDAAHGGRVFLLLNEALADVMIAFLDEQPARFDTAAQHAQVWLASLVTPITNAVAAIPDDLDAAAIYTALGEGLTRLVEFARTLSMSAVRAFIDPLIDILTVDLGISTARIEALIRQLFTALVTKLRAAPPDADRNVQRNRLEIASILKRLLRFIGTQFHFPEFSTESITRGIMDLLDRIGLDELLTRVNCAADAITTAFTAAAAMVDLVPFTGAGSGSVGAADVTTVTVTPPKEQYCFYASWLLGGRVWVNKERTKVIHGDDTPENVIHSGTDVNWYDAPIFKDPQHTPYYAVDLVKPDALEKVAFHTAHSQHLLQDLMNIFSMENGDLANNLTNFIHESSVFFWTAIDEKPPFGLHENDFLRLWLMPMSKGLLTFVSSFEGMHTKSSGTNAFIFWLTLLGADVVETLMYWDYSRLLRSHILSILTLLNQKNPPTGGSAKKSDNFREVQGVVEPFADLILFLVLILPIGKDAYAEPFNAPAGNQAKADNNRDLLLMWFLATPAVAMLGGLTGVLVSMAFSRNFDWRQLLRQSLGGWEYMIRAFLKFWIYLYLHYDGDTDDGTYNAVAGAPPMPGYADASTSPYLLPYTGTKQCAQGNKGIWSHHDFSGRQQIYAYDFAHDFGDEVLASRGGTVIDFFDWVPDDTDPGAGGANAPGGATIAGQTTSSRWNFVLIRHDAIDNTHDQDTTGVIQTFAIYGHGQTNGVRQAWANKLGVDISTVTPAMIINTTVIQGEVIMLAGDTGISAYNHLHMHVLNGPNGNNNQTLPFVYRDGGRCKSLDYYSSQNVRTP